jgi:hypothetical protein
VFAGNFRTRVFNYFARRGPDEELTMEEAQALSSKSPWAANDTVDTSDPIIRKNVTNILHKIMTEDSGTWKALAYFEECKLQYPGFEVLISMFVMTKRACQMISFVKQAIDKYCKGIKVDVLFQEDFSTTTLKEPPPN